MKLLLIIGSLVYSLLALVMIYLIVMQKMNKMYFIAAVYFEIIVILCLIKNEPGYFGLCGVVGLFPIIRKYIS